MDKKTVSSYLTEIKELMCSGRYIDAWKKVEFLREQMDYDVEQEKLNG